MSRKAVSIKVSLRAIRNSPPITIITENRSFALRFGMQTKVQTLASEKKNARLLEIIALCVTFFELPMSVSDTFNDRYLGERSSVAAPGHHIQVLQKDVVPGVVRDDQKVTAHALSANARSPYLEQVRRSRILILCRSTSGLPIEPDDLFSRTMRLNERLHFPS